MPDTAPGMLEAFTIYTEKIPEAGEDAPPLWFSFPDGAGGVGAVFDGMGGAGSGQLATENGVETGARRAARVAKAALQKFIGPAFSVEDHAEPSDGERLYERFSADALQRIFDEALSDEARAISPLSASRLKSKMMRTLPTTFAGAIWRRYGGLMYVRALWAGDSRVYYLSMDGLEQLTSDHVRASSGDRYEGGGDAPLTNFLSEVTPNRVEGREFSPRHPGFIVCATDGVYGYFPSDAHLECALWGAIVDSLEHGPESASASLSREVTRFAQDDTSAVVFPVGFDLEDLAGIRARLRVSLATAKDIDQIDVSLRDNEAERQQLLGDRAKLIQRAKAREIALRANGDEL